VRKVLITEQDAFIKPIILRRLLQVQSGDGLFTTEGALWRAHRKMIAPAFSASRLHAAVPIMSQQANAVVDRWLAEIDAAPGGCLRGVDVQPVMSDLALRVVGGAAFGTDIEPILPLFAPQKAISPAGFTLQFIMSFLPGFAQLPLPNALVGTKHVRQLRDRLLAIILRRVEERRAAAAATTTAAAGSAAGAGEGEDPATAGALLKAGQSGSKQAQRPGQKAPAYLLDFLLDAVDESDAAVAAGGKPVRAEERLTLQNVLDEARTFVISGVLVRRRNVTSTGCCPREQVPLFCDRTCPSMPPDAATSQHKHEHSHSPRCHAATFTREHHPSVSHARVQATRPRAPPCAGPCICSLHTQPGRPRCGRRFVSAWRQRRRRRTQRPKRPRAAAAAARLLPPWRRQLTPTALLLALC
jgi:hypothetical protein